VVISFVIFRIESMSEVFAYLGGMFGIGLKEATVSAGISLGMYQVRNYAVLMIAALVIALGIPKRFWEKVVKTAWGMKAARIVTPVVYVILLLVVTAFLIQSSVHPFLYFRF